MNTIYNNIVNAIKANKTIGKHLATVKNHNNGSGPRAAIEVYERNVYVWLDINRRMFDKAIEQLETEHNDLFTWGAFTKADGGEGPYIELGMTEDTIKSLKTERECENSEEESKPFFIAGQKYRCIRDVKMKQGGETAFKAGNVYEQSCEPSHWCGWLTNEKGDRHAWPQPVYIPDCIKTWNSKPEDMDPRNYFEPVAA